MSIDNVPDQPLNPPEFNSKPSYWEIIEHEQDRLIDEAKLNDNNRNSKS